MALYKIRFCTYTRDKFPKEIFGYYKQKNTLINDFDVKQYTNFDFT